jgi:hypothetical protein
LFPNIFFFAGSKPIAKGYLINPTPAVVLVAAIKIKAPFDLLSL